MNNKIKNNYSILKPSVIISISAFLVSCGGGGGSGVGSSQPYTPPAYKPSPPSSDSISTPPTVVPKQPSPPRILQPSPPSKPPKIESRPSTQGGSLVDLPEKSKIIQLASEQVNINNHDNFGDENNIKVISIIDSGLNNSVYNQNVRSAKPTDPATEQIHGVHVTNIVYNGIKEETKRNNKAIPIIWTLDASNGFGKELSINSQYFIDMYNNRGARIFNNSWGTESDFTPFQYLIGLKRGLIGTRPEEDSIFVFAAGNKGHDYPTIEASYPEVNDNARNGFIAVAAYDEGDTSRLASYSNKFTDKSKKWGITANGTYRYVVKNYNSISEYITTGTSFAAPRVSAAIANVWNKFPWMSNHLVTVTILSTADIPGTNDPTKGPDSGKNYKSTDDCGGPAVSQRCSDPKFGWGILNEERALKGPALLHRDLLTNKDNIKNFIYLLTVDFDYRDYQDKSKLTWSNDIKGDGGIYKKGTGILYLSGDNQYSGSTQIENGEIVLQKKLNNSYVNIKEQGSLKAEGLNNNTTVEIGQTVNNEGGTLKVYGKGLNIKESYIGTGKAKIVIDIDKSTLNVSKNLDFGEQGYLVADIQETNNIPTTQAKQRTIITANKIDNFNEQNRRISANISPFINIYDLSLNQKNNKQEINTTYSRKNGEVVVASLGYESNDVAYNTAKNLDVVLDTLSNSNYKDKDSEIFKASVSILSAPVSALSSKIDSLSGEIYSSSQNILAKQNEVLNKTLSNRISSLMYETKSGFWFDQVLANVNLKNKGYSNTKTDINSFMVGLDHKNDNFILGASVLSGKTKANFDRKAGDININNLGFNLYGSYNFNDFYILGRIGFNNSKSEVKREILDKYSKISYDSKIYNTYTEIGKIFNIGNFSINPFLALQLDMLKRGNISEKEVFGLQADSKTYKLNSFLTGIKTKIAFNKLNITSNLTYGHKPFVNDFAFNANFTGINALNKNIKIIGIKEAKNTVWLGSNIAYNITKNLNLNFGFDMSFDSSKNNNKIFNFGALYRF